jgi:hypothetical protein
MTAQTIEQRTERAWGRLIQRRQGARTINGPETTREDFADEFTRELEEALAESAQDHAVQIATAQAAAQQREGELQLQVNALAAALAEARARSTQVGPVTGTMQEWERRLAAMPPLATHEVESWRTAALRRLARIGTTQADVMIVRLAEVLLRPHQWTSAGADDAPTH